MCAATLAGQDEGQQNGSQRQGALTPAAARTTSPRKASAMGSKGPSHPQAKLQASTGTPVFLFLIFHCPSPCAAGANSREQDSYVKLWLQGQSAGSCPALWDRWEAFSGATENLSKCLILLQVQKKQISQASLSLPCFRGRTSLHTFIRGLGALLLAPIKNPN